MTTSQNYLILKHLLDGYKLTPIGALHLFKCFRLSARVESLRKSGWPIRTTLIKKGRKVFAEYSF